MRGESCTAGMSWRIAVSTAAILLMASAGVLATSRLNGTMRAWRSDARMMNDMMLGRSAFDPAIIEKALQAYADDAQRIAGTLDARTAEGRDFKAHFVTFASDVQAAQADVGQRTRLQAGLTRVFGDCRSCHDKYKN
jgi:cytochrome c556